MSASVAPPMAGLHNHDYGPDNMSDFTAHDFTDHHVQLDRLDELNNDVNHQNDSSSYSQTQNNVPAIHHETSPEEQKEALGNLLGALMPMQKVPGGDGSDFPLQSSSFPAQEQPALHQQPNENHADEYDPSRLPSFDATAANDLFSAENVSRRDSGMDVPQPPNDDNTHGNIMAHGGQNLSMSQGDVAHPPPTPQQREFEAFARLQFEDGSYYLNTYSCELGRDVLAYKAALQKEREEREAELNRHDQSQSSSGRASHPSGRMRRQPGSQIHGSVVSEQGGFAGIDEVPVRHSQNPDKPTMSSQESESSLVKPAEYLINPRTMPFDYHRSTEIQARWTAQEENGGELEDDEQPAAVTAAHMPNPHMCPLIPIHGKPKDGQTDAELHKKISRRHVRIKWSFALDCWEMVVQGRNGAFCNGKFVPYKGVRTLLDGAVIQIAHVVLTFRLPTAAQDMQETEDRIDIDADEAIPSVESCIAESLAEDERRNSITEQRPAPKISLKISQKTEPQSAELPLGPDGLPIPKRRGPGRPPKDGIMSTRERREREKAAKLAAAREANGGKTPPPSARSKAPKPSPPAVEDAKIEPKPEKRKYTKRKATDENGNSVLDADGEGEAEDGATDKEPKQKKARPQRERSESPEYPPRESLTAEQLARPTESYAPLMYRILSELYPRALPLKDIYRELKKRYPYFVYEAQTEGWQSSVRHNLNSEHGKYFDKGDKEGKGYAWKAIPNASLPTAERRRTTQPTVQRPRAPSQQQQFQPLPSQSVQWQNNGPFAPNGNQQQFVNQGSWPQQGQSGNWQQDGTVPGSVRQPVSGSTPSLVQPNSISPNPQASSSQVRGMSQSGQTGNGSLAPPNVIHPPTVSPGLAPSNMPCTLDGIEAIQRFETAMWGQMPFGNDPERREFWAGVFASAKKRVLHGHPVSTHPRGDTKEEETIMKHLQNFVTIYANPGFKGFTPRVGQLTATEASSPQVQATTQAQESEAPSGASPGSMNAEGNGQSTAESPPATTIVDTQDPGANQNSTEQQIEESEQGPTVGEEALHDESRSQPSESH